ncbi:hypothetical protein MMC29_007542 [Sticta canariensis]|nr:hypothetical protein [Sticta canariensis]
MRLTRLKSMLDTPEAAAVDYLISMFHTRPKTLRKRVTNDVDNNASHPHSDESGCCQLMLQHPRLLSPVGRPSPIILSNRNTVTPIHPSAGLVDPIPAVTTYNVEGS